jgi:mono/diheme cytochrome c family protein
MNRTATLVFALLASTACSMTEVGFPQRALATASATTPERRGLAFAEARCAACHAVRPGLSPNPQAPTFEGVINTPGLDIGTLATWLRNSHDFPAMMNFAIEPERIDDLAAYMLTLKDPAYKPTIQ